MSTDKQTATQSHPARFPLLVSLLLLLCIGGVLYWQHRQHTALQANLLAAAEKKYAELHAEDDALRSILALEPCEAKKTLSARRSQ